MRRFELMRDGAKTDPKVERACLVGIIEQRKGHLQALRDMLDIIERFPALFEDKTPEDIIQVFIDIDEKWNVRDEADLKEVETELGLA